MCELHVTVKLQRGTYSLSNTDSHFFPNQKNSCSCSLLYVCTTAQHHIGTNVRLSKENEVGSLWEFVVYIISNNVCGLA
jgi:hypothetical protein